MTHGIRIALAVLLATLTLTFGASTASAETKDECATDPNSLGCKRQIADEQCATYGPESIECLSARNVYLEEYAARGDNWIETLTAWVTRLSERIATLEKRVEHLKAKVKRLKSQLR